MRSFLKVAALAAALTTASLATGYAQSSRDTQPGGALDEDSGRPVIDLSTNTQSIMRDASTGSPDHAVQNDQEESDAAPTTVDKPYTPCPSGLGTGNGDCR